MAGKTWTLIDVAGDVYTPELSLAAGDLGKGAEGCSVTKQSLRGGLCEGVDTIRVENGEFSFVVLPTRGMNVWKAWLGDWEIGWRSPVRGPVHPQFVPLAEPSGLGWLGGFDELIARCGLESNGAPEFDEHGRLQYGLHGRIANRPAHRVVVEYDEETREIAVTGVVEETRFLFANLRLTSTIRTKAGEASFQICDEVENLSARDGQMQLLYHINLGPPLLEPGAEAVIPARKVAPRDPRAAEGIRDWNRYEGPEPGFAEQVYFFDLHAESDGATQTLLKNADGARGVSLRFNKQSLPCFILWKNTAALEDGYVTGLEPATNFPNPHSYEAAQGRVVALPPGGKATFDLELAAHGEAASLARAEEAVRALTGDAVPEILGAPEKGWTPPPL